MGIKTFLASLMMLITIAVMCSPLYLVWLGLTMSGSALVRIGLIVVGLILCRLFKPIKTIKLTKERIYYEENFYSFFRC